MDERGPEVDLMATTGDGPEFGRVGQFIGFLLIVPAVAVNYLVNRRKQGGQDDEKA